MKPSVEPQRVAPSALLVNSLSNIRDPHCLQGPIEVTLPGVSSVAAYVLQITLTLVGVVALAVVLLVAARRMGVGGPVGPLDLVGRLPLDGRRAIYLVRVRETVFVIGASDGGLVKLGELPADGLDAASAIETAGSFKEALARVVGRSGKVDATGPEEVHRVG